MDITIRWHLNNMMMFLHSVILLTECIVIIGVRKTWGFLSVCLCMCLSVCEQPFAETIGPISTKLTQMSPLMI